MSRKKSKKAKGKKPLDDHKRHGKKFIPPFAQIGPLREVSWMDDLLPELLWISLLNERFGLRRGIRLVEAIVRRGNELLRSDQRPWLCLTSAYASLDHDQQAALRTQLDSAGLLDDIRPAIAPLVAHYPRCDLRFLFESEPAVTGVDELRRAIQVCLNRWDEPATMLQVQAVYTAMVQERFFFKHDSVFANFPAVELYPDTEESRMIASACRATVNSFLTQDVRDAGAEWCKYFWSRGLELEPCAPVEYSDA